MTDNRRLPFQLFTGLAIALVLLMTGTPGVISAGIAATLIVTGLILYPAHRRVGSFVAVIAAVAAIAVALALRSL